MKLEERYFVLKWADIERALDIKSASALGEIFAYVNQSRAERKAGPLECLVIERDWPEYIPALRALEERVDREEANNATIKWANSFPPSVPRDVHGSSELLDRISRRVDSDTLDLVNAYAKLLAYEQMCKPFASKENEE